MSLGLKRGTVTVVDYDPLWPQNFDEEKARLFTALGRELLAVEHVGSTSVPGLVSKPIIDMIGAVESFDRLDYFIDHLQKLGYEYMPDRMFEARKFFPKGDQSYRTHHLNLVIKNDPEQWNNIILFRDYLRQNDTVRDQYANLKQKIAHEYSDNRYAYTKAKNDFIQKSLQDIK